MYTLFRRKLLTLYRSGIWHCIKLYWNRYAPWPMRMTFYLSLFKFVFSKNKSKRLLGIWDFKYLPWSVGDPLVFIETLNILKLEYDVEEVDICIIYDRENPSGIRSSCMTSENAQDYMLDYLPLFGTCQFLGSVFQFSSRKEFYRYLKLNLDRYQIFPPLVGHLGGTYNYYDGADMSPISKFYDKHNYIPYLRISDRETSWALKFYREHIPLNTVPVVLSLKNTTHDDQRNADPAAWLPFIELCGNTFTDVVFILIGLKGEEPEGIRQHNNVVVAKDYGTTLLEDMALIRSSFFYMATISGITTVALFSDTPYIFFQMRSFVMEKNQLSSGKNFRFATEKQKLFDETFIITPEFLYNEFRRMYHSLDKQQWLSKMVNSKSQAARHPSALIRAEDAEAEDM